MVSGTFHSVVEEHLRVLLGRGFGMVWLVICRVCTVSDALLLPLPLVLRINLVA